MGNIWRFPYMVGQNGGGTFIVAYAICILAIGLPIMILESSAGNLASRGPVGSSVTSTNAGGLGLAGFWSL